VRPSLAALGLAMSLAGLLPAGAVAQSGLTADGTEFVLTLNDGRTLRGTDLKGATLKMRTPEGVLDVTIQGIEEDPHAVGGRVLLHHFVARDASGKIVDVCFPDADGKSLGFPVPDGRGGFELTCTSGAIAKCIRWGYRPWDERPGGAPLRALHRACVHMVRADYGGDGSTHTRDGTLIYVCDRFGIMACETDAPLALEAAWGELGATCVAHPRIPELVTLTQPARRHARLNGALGPAACTQESAARNPAALLFNRSRD
jgi:hypothetical protein